MYSRWNEEYYQHCVAKWEWMECQVERAIEKEKEKELNEKKNSVLDKA